MAFNQAGTIFYPLASGIVGGFVTQGVSGFSGISGTSGYNINPNIVPNYCTIKAFLSHVERRKNKVLILIDKLNHTRETMPLHRTLDLIYRYACISPFTVNHLLQPIILLFEFDDNEFKLSFESAKTSEEKAEALNLDETQLKAYHKEKVADIEHTYTKII